MKIEIDVEDEVANSKCELKEMSIKQLDTLKVHLNFMLKNTIEEIDRRTTP